MTLQVLIALNTKSNQMTAEQAPAEQAPAELQVAFHDCAYGWIKMDVRIGECLTTFPCSNLYDPAPDLLAWLEGISLGLTRIAWTLDEEGCSVEFEAQTAETSEWGAPPFDPMRLLIRPSYCQALPTLELSRATLVDTFYAAFRAFAESADYLPAQWECITHAALVHERAGMPAQSLVERLSQAPVSRREVQEALWKVDRSISAFGGDDLMQAGTPEDHQRLIGEPCPDGFQPTFWRLPEWDGLDEAGRREWLTDWLDDPWCSWNGTPWPAMRSPWIEHWQQYRDEPNAGLRWLSPQWPQQRWPTAGPTREARAICGEAIAGAAVEALVNRDDCLAR